MATECIAKLFGFEAVKRRAVVASVDGDITSNAGGLLLGQVDRGLGLVGELDRLAALTRAVMLPCMNEDAAMVHCRAGYPLRTGRRSG
jgi:hypothetical protein